MLEQKQEEKKEHWEANFPVRVENLRAYSEYKELKNEIVELEKKVSAWLEKTDRRFGEMDEKISLLKKNVDDLKDESSKPAHKKRAHTD